MKLESILSHNAAQDDESIRNVLQGSHIAVCCNICLRVRRGKQTAAQGKEMKVESSDWRACNKGPVSTLQPGKLPRFRFFNPQAIRVNEH